MPETLKSTVKEALAKTGLGRPLVSIISRWKKSMHSRKMLRFYSQFVDRGSLCYDVGANVGNRTQAFRKLGARVIAVEPQTACVKILRQRFGADTEVVVVPMGLSNAPGKALLSLSQDSTTIASFSPEFREKWRWANQVQWDAEEPVELTTLDELIKRYGVPQFCKIDVEGFEEQVLGGLSQPIPWLSFEFNIEFIAQTERCIEKLKALDYHRYNYSHGESMCLNLHQWIEGDQLVQLLKSPDDPLFWGDVYVSK